MAAAAVLRIEIDKRGQARGVEGGRGGIRPVEFHFDRAPRGLAVAHGFQPTRNSYTRRVTGCHAQKSSAILSVNGRHRPRDIESRTNMSTVLSAASLSAIIDLSPPGTLVFHPLAWFMIQSETVLDRS